MSVNCVLWSSDMNSTLGSVVPLAMFFKRSSIPHLLQGGALTSPFKTDCTIAHYYIHPLQIHYDPDSRLSCSSCLWISWISTSRVHHRAKTNISTFISIVKSTQHILCHISIFMSPQSAVKPICQLANLRMLLVARLTVTITFEQSEEWGMVINGQHDSKTSTPDNQTQNRRSEIDG